MRLVPSVNNVCLFVCFCIAGLLDDLILCRPSLFVLMLSVGYILCMLSYSIYWSQSSDKLTYLLTQALRALWRSIASSKYANVKLLSAITVCPGPFNYPKDGERRRDGRKTIRRKTAKDGKRHVLNGPDDRPNFCRLCQTGPFRGHHFLLIKTTATHCCISIIYSRRHSPHTS